MFRFLNIFAKKWDFLPKQLLSFFRKFDHNLVFLEKTPIFAEYWQKSQKIVIITSTPGRAVKPTNPSEFYQRQSRGCKGSHRRMDLLRCMSVRSRF
jgi:hypothetical protein